MFKEIICQTQIRTKAIHNWGSLALASLKQMLFRFVDVSFLESNAPKNHIGILYGVAIIPVSREVVGKCHQVIGIFASVVSFSDDKAFLRCAVKGMKSLFICRCLMQLFNGLVVSLLRSRTGTESASAQQGEKQGDSVFHAVDQLLTEKNTRNHLPYIGHPR